MSERGEEEEYDPYDDVPEWTEEDEERYQARRHEDLRRRRRRRRQGWSFAVLVALVLGAGVAGAGIIQGWWEWPFGSEAEADALPGCSPQDVTISQPGEVRINVLNATDVRGLAAAVATEMERRGYTVADVGNEEGQVEVLDPVQIRYGAPFLADAQSVALHFRGVLLVDDGRTADVVDVVLGQGYSRMGGAEAAAQVIADAVPQGCDPTTSGTPAPTATATG